MTAHKPKKKQIEISALGFDVDPATKKYVINEDEAKIIRIIFDKYSNGIGYVQILDYLNPMGYKTKFGKPFAKNSLNTILKNEKYIGTYTYNKKVEKDAMGRRNAKLKPKEEWIIIPNGIPAIVDEDVFKEVQIKMQENLKHGGRHKAKEIYLLSGLLFCGECGSRMYGNSRKCGRNKSLYVSYKCSNRDNEQGCNNKELRREYLENFVLDSLYNNLFNNISLTKLSSMLADYNNRQREESKEELSDAKEELTSALDKISNIIKLVTETGISIDTVRTELKELEERKLYLEQYINELTLHKRNNIITEEMITDLINKSKDFIRSKNIAECRQFITTYVNRVMIYADRVEVAFNISVPSAENILEPLTAEENIKTIQRKYKAV